jgi:thiamine pyrophosphokinase
MHAIVVADGDAPERSALDLAWPGWDAGCGLVVAADGGARAALDLGLRIDRWVGDADSIDGPSLARLRENGVDVTVLPADKDESDAELAILAALEAGATELTIVGALGGLRLDHALANLSLLWHPALEASAVHCRLLDAAARVSLVRASSGAVHRSLPGEPGGLVTLIALPPGVEGVTTVGLRYALRDEPLVAGTTRGLSNVREAPDASVSLRRGRLLIVETAATLRP